MNTRLTFSQGSLAGILALGLLWTAPVPAQDVQMQEIPTQQMPVPDPGAMGGMNMDMGHALNSQAMGVEGTGGLDEAARFLFASPEEAALMRAEVELKAAGDAMRKLVPGFPLPWRPIPREVRDSDEYKRAKVGWDEAGKNFNEAYDALYEGEAGTPSAEAGSAGAADSAGGGGDTGAADSAGGDSGGDSSGGSIMDQIESVRGPF